MKQGRLEISQAGVGLAGPPWDEFGCACTVPSVRQPVWENLCLFHGLKTMNYTSVDPKYDLEAFNEGFQ